MEKLSRAVTECAILGRCGNRSLRRLSLQKRGGKPGRADQLSLTHTHTKKIQKKNSYLVCFSISTLCPHEMGQTWVSKT